MYKKIILASASPRRKELLSNIGLKFEVKPSLTEEHVEYFLNYGDYVKKLAERKAFSVYKDNKDYLIVASDTIVVIDEEILNKPKNETDAFNMLKKLSGREHVVYTSVCILDDENKISDYKATKVKFIELSDDEIKKYIATKEPLDKAGAYGIQGFGSKYIEEIDGCYFSVMGFPVSLFASIMKKIGYEI